MSAASEDGLSSEDTLGTESDIDEALLDDMLDFEGDASDEAAALGNERIESEDTTGDDDDGDGDGDESGEALVPRPKPAKDTPTPATATPAAAGEGGDGQSGDGQGGGRRYTRRRKPNTLLEPDVAAKKLMEKPTTVNALNWMRVADGTSLEMLTAMHKKLETHVWLKEEDRNTRIDLEAALEKAEQLLGLD